MERFAIGIPILKVVNAVILIKDGPSVQKIGQSCAELLIAEKIMVVVNQSLIAIMVLDYAMRVRITNKQLSTQCILESAVLLFLLSLSFESLFIHVYFQILQQQ